MRPEHYKELVDGKIKELKEKNKIKEDKIKLTREAQTIFDEFSFGRNLGLLGWIRSETRR